ncbi:MAG: filamentous hemagglutinin N-terminal domain-containing protein [Leptolyngbyaceae cyanobacterium]
MHFHTPSLVYGLLSAAVISTVCISWHAQAQVIPDETLESEKSIVTEINPDTYRIEGGALRDSLLFHSFEAFSIPEGQGIYFANPEEVTTIFSRVTGSAPSQLFGTLGVMGEADLIFLNPNGVLLGPNTELDLQGTFTVTTATQVVFPGGEVFSAVAPEAVPLLTVDVQPQVGVVFEGIGQGVISSEGALEIDGDLTFIANNVELVDASLHSSGAITLIAGNELILNNADVQSINWGATPGGDVSATTSELSLINGGRIRTTAAGSGPGGNLTITARQFRVQGIEDRMSGLTTDTLLNSSGDGGDIVVNAGAINILGTDPQAFTPDPENSSSVLATGLSETGFTTTTLGTGNAGNLTITTAELSTRHRAGIATATLGLSENAGNGGTLRVNANTVEFQGLAGLSSTNLGSGDSGDVVVDVDTLSLMDGATLTADAIAAEKLIQQLPQTALGEDSNLNSWLEIAQNSVSLTDLGHAGNISISSAGDVLLDNQSRISTNSFTGDEGNISITTASVLLLRRGNGIGGIFTNSSIPDFTGKGGRISISAEVIHALPLENTDISAIAYLGLGNGTYIEAGDIIGLAFRNQLTPLSDITIGSEIEILQLLEGLPNEPQEPELLIEGCTVTNNNQAAGFFDLGRGGKLPGPEDFVTADTIIAEWISLNILDTETSQSEPFSDDFQRTGIEPYLVANCGVDDE